MNKNGIKQIEDEHGTTYFGMALSHLFDDGHKHITPEYVKNIKAVIMAKATEKTGGGTPIMTPEFQCYLLDICLELTRFSIWDLLAYVKNHLYMGEETCKCTIMRKT